MSDFKIKLMELKQKVFSDEMVVEYYRVKKAMENNEELIKLAEKIRFHQQEMTTNMDSDEIYFREKSIYEALLKEYDNHPLVVNYQAVKNEIVRMLSQLKDIIE